MRAVALVLLLAGCGGSDNPFYDNAGDYCFTRGGVSLIEGGYVYCGNGEYIEEDKL